MTSLIVLARLRAMHRRLLALIAPLDDAQLRLQFHPDLSPLGWHLGHCAYVENYWLRERVQKDNRLSRKQRDLYTPELSPKPERGARLPDKDTLMHQAEEQLTNNILLLSGTAEALKPHPLLTDEYLELFLLQHHSMHYETMNMALTQRALKRHRNTFLADKRLHAAPLDRSSVLNPAGDYHIGGQRPQAFDNELPAFVATLDKFSIAQRPLSNAQYLSFMQEGGYAHARYWSKQGSEWLRNTPADAPEHWRQDARGWWYGIGVDGPFDLPPDEPVYGINYFEAQACAAWAGARLPHEHEWESACNSGQLLYTGRVWEWCDNTFAPYEGFEPFPYEGYSSPWFDGKHHVLRGASVFTRADLRRPSLRNFHTPEKRYIFAGLRLVF